MDYTGGRLAENIIRDLYIEQGYVVIPIYDFEISENVNNKGPKIYTTDGRIISPDMLAISKNGDDAFWIEAKQKSVFAWFFNDSCWTTGIDLHHLSDYDRLQKLCNLPILLMFLHTTSGDESDMKHPCPTGLYYQRIDWLTKNIHSISNTAGRNGMAYWRESQLIKIATIEQLQARIEQYNRKSA